MPVLYSFVRGMLRLGLRAYFREIEVRGRENVPGDGPCVFVANHQNSMMDPFLIIIANRRPLSFLAKAPLFSTPVMGSILRGIGCIPVYRKQDGGYDKKKNDSIYEAALAALARSAALAIFPEGKSHTEPHLEEFRHGASKIALEAETRHGGVRIQLVGLHFELARGFRGKALVQFGPALPLEEWKARFAEDPRTTTAALTEELHRRLSEMILAAESHEILRQAELVRKLDVLQRGSPADLKESFDRKKFILDSYRELRELCPDEVEALRVDLARYQSVLDLLGIEDEQVARSTGFGRMFLKAGGSTLLLLLTLPVMAAGIVGNFPPYILAWGLSRLFSGSADRQAGIALEISLGLFPLYWAGLAIAGWLLFGPIGLVTALTAAPICGAVALRWMDAWHRMGREAWGFWTAVSTPTARAKMRRLRGRVLARVEKLAQVLTKT